MTLLAARALQRIFNGRKFVSGDLDLWPLTLTSKLVRARDQTRVPGEYSANPFSGSRDISYTNEQKSYRQRQKRTLRSSQRAVITVRKKRHTGCGHLQRTARCVFRCVGSAFLWDDGELWSATLGSEDQSPCCKSQPQHDTRGDTVPKRAAEIGNSCCRSQRCVVHRWVSAIRSQPCTRLRLFRPDIRSLTFVIFLISSIPRPVVPPSDAYNSASIIHTAIKTTSKFRNVSVTVGVVDRLALHGKQTWIWNCK